MSKAYRVLGLFSILLLVGCQSSRSKLAETESYLSAPSRLQLGKPVLFLIHDQRAEIERTLTQNGGPWRYTTDTDNPDRASLSLGKSLSETMQRKGMTHQASFGLPATAVPTNTLIIRVAVASWYGRLENPLPVTGTMIALLSPGRPILAEGYCEFSSVLETDGQRVDLGTSKGSIKTSVPTASKPTVYKEGDYLSGVAVSHAMAEFFKSLETQWPAKYAPTKNN